MPSTSAEVRGLVIHDIKEVEGVKQKEVKEAKGDEERESEVDGEVGESHSTCASNLRMTMGSMNTQT